MFLSLFVTLSVLVFQFFGPTPDILWIGIRQNLVALFEMECRVIYAVSWWCLFVCVIACRTLVFGVCLQGAAHKLLTHTLPLPAPLIKIVATLARLTNTGPVLAVHAPSPPHKQTQSHSLPFVPERQGPGPGQAQEAAAPNSEADAKERINMLKELVRAA